MAQTASSTPNSHDHSHQQKNLAGSDPVVHLVWQSASHSGQAHASGKSHQPASESRSLALLLTPPSLQPLATESVRFRVAELTTREILSFS